MKNLHLIETRRELRKNTKKDQAATRSQKDQSLYGEGTVPVWQRLTNHQLISNLSLTIDRTFTRYAAMILCVLMLGVGNVWAWNTLYLASSNNSWSTSADGLNNSSGGTGVLYTYATENMEFKIVNSYNTTWLGRDSGDKLKPGDSGFNFDKAKSNNCTYNGKTGVVGFNCDQTGTNADDWPWIWLTRPTVYIYHYWNNKSYSTVAMTDNNDGTYKYIGNYSSSSKTTRVGPNSDCSSDGAVVKKFSSPTSSVGSPTNGDRCIFEWNASGYIGKGSGTANTGSLTVTKLYSLSYDDNGASSGSAPSGVTDAKWNVTQTVAAKGTLAKTGYVFVGWNTAANGSGTDYAPGATFSPSAVSTTLYAQWVAIHETSKYTTAAGSGGYGKSYTTYSSRDYEWYGVYKNGSNNKILPDATGSDVLAVGTFVNNTGSISDWIGAKFSGNGSNSTSSAIREFPTCSHNVLLATTTNVLTLVVKGYDQFGILAQDGNGTKDKNQYLRVYIDGDEVTVNAEISNTISARHYDLDDDGTAHIIRITGGSSSGGNRIWAFSLRIPSVECDATQPGEISKGTLSACSLPLTAGGSPASNNTWYWQASSTGTSTSESGATKSVSEAGTYYVRSYYSTGKCWSNAESITVSASDLTPAAPTALAASSATAKGVTLTVTDAANTNDYEFYVSTDDDEPSSGATATHSVTSAKSLTITNLYAGTKFYAWARAKCGSNKSAWTALTDDSFTTSTVSVTHTLTNVTKTSGATSGVGGSAYTAVYSANTDYSMPTPSVTIGGNTATSGTDYTWTSGTGTISIPANKITGDIVITMNSAATAPTNVAISGTYHYYPGETISLTATPTGGNGPKTYQWYHGGKADGNAIDGATSATFSKTCVVGDAGDYYCKVTCGGSASRWSDGASQNPYQVKVMQFYLKNSSGSDISNHALVKGADASHASLSLSLTGGTTYKFRVTDGCNNWYGNSDETGMTSSNCTNWTMPHDADCKMTTNSKSATYTFNFDFSAGLLGSQMKVSVVYPEGNQASGKVIYWDNSVLEWDAGDQWYRIGKGTHNNKTQMSLVSGTANLYKVTTAEYNGFEYWHIANNEGEGTGNIFWTKDSDDETDEEITAAMGFEGSPVTADAVTVTPGTDHSTGGSSDNNNCEFYSYTITSGMKTDRVSISSYSNGTITVNYVNTSNVASSFTTGYADVAHTCKLTSITAVPNTGYTIDDDITINEDDYEANYVVTGATTVAASFKPATYSVTLNTNNGTINSGNVTSYTYLTGATLPTDVTRSGYRFMGWYADDEFEGDRVYSISTSATGNKEYWAKWAQLYAITDGEPSNGSLAITDGSSAITEAIAGETVYIEATPSTGYVFDEWNIYKTSDAETTVSPAAATASTSFTMPAYAVTVDASFVVKTYSLSYDLDDASGAASGGTSAGSYAEGTTITTPAVGTLIKSGYTFRGWTDGTTFYLAGQSFSMPASNVTLTAVWESNGTTITLSWFDSSQSNNSSNKPDSQGKWLYGYTNSAKTSSYAYTLTTTNTNNKGQGTGDSDYLRLYYGTSYYIYADNTGTGGTPSTFSNVIAVSVKVKLKKTAPTLTIKVGSTTIANAVSLSSASTSEFTTFTYNNLSKLSGKIEIINNGSGSTDYDIYIDDIAITTQAAVSNYNVTFSADGKTASNMPSKIEGVPSGKKILRPSETPTASGFIFSKWVTTSGGSTEFDFANTTITADKTIYAKWTAKTQPTQYSVSGTAAICPDGNTDITLSGSQSGISYQLYKGEDVEGDPKAGTGSSLTWNVSAADTYTVKAVENATYAARDMSGSAIVTLKTAVSLSGSASVSPASPLANVAFTISGLTSVGTGKSGQWYRSNSSGELVSTITGKTSDEMSITETSAGTYYYKYKVTGDCGDPAVSPLVTVTVAASYLLTYDANDGSGAPDAVYLAAGSTTLSSTIPTYSGYRFLGWNTEDDGSGTRYAAGASFTMPAAATTLYAEWQEVATLTWNLLANTKDTPFGTHGTSGNTSTNTSHVLASNMTDLASEGIGLYDSGKSAVSGKTAALVSTDGKDNDKYVYVTFKVATNYEFVPTSLAVPVSRISNNSTWDAVLTDGNNQLTGTYTSTADGNNNIVFTNVGNVAFKGTVTLKIWAYRSGGGGYRLVTPITISGDVNYICPERATITSPTAPQSIKLYTDQSKTLSVSATAYAGTLNYQWQKDGEDIDGATSATYTVVGSSLTAGTTYKYTCNVSETSPASCATVTSPAVTIKAASTDCGYTEIASAVLTSKTSATCTNATLLYANMSNSSAPYKLDKTIPSYFGLQLSSGNFQVGDSIIFKVKIGDMDINGGSTYPVAFYHTTDTSSYTTSNLIYTSGAQTKNTDNVYIRFIVTQAMIDAGLTNKILIIRSGRVKQNHSMYEARIKRYGCPDIYVFDDASGDGLWSEEDNWIGATGHGSGLPTIEDRAIITKPITVDIAHATAAAVILDQSDSKTGKLTIQANQGLEVAGTVTRTTDGSNSLATREQDLVLESSSAGNASLIFDNSDEENLNQATVQMYSKAGIDGSTWNWQYVGTPFTGSIPQYNYYGSWMYKWNNGGWSVVHGNDVLDPFAGYCLTQESATTHVMGGTLVPTTSKSVTMAASTDMVLANSWTAPISIASFTASTFTSTPATIYLFNTGSATKEDGGAKEGSAAGTYIAVPIASAPYTGNGLIAPMQGFFVTTVDGSSGTITMNYNDLVRPAGSHTTIVGGPMKARKQVETKPDVMKIRVEGSRYSDRVVILAREDFSQGFDNGWDGEKKGYNSAAPAVFVINEQGKNDAVSAIPTFEGTVVGFRAGTDNSCTMTFEYDGDETLYLNDLQAQQSTLIDAAQTYTFTTSANDSEVRFIISATPITKITTGIGNGGLMNGENDGMVRKLIINDHVYIIRSGRMYGVDGQMVK